MTTDNEHSAHHGAAETLKEAVKEVASPTAPGKDDASGVVIDLAHVLPRTGSPEKLLWLGVGSGTLFTILAVAVGTHSVPTGTMDGTIHAWIITHRAPLNIDVANALTWGGSTIVTLPALIVIGALALKGPRRPLDRIGAGFLLAGVASLGIYLGLVINQAMGGERPDPLDWAGAAGGPTFPSGHTTAATVFAACCVWAIAPRMKTRGQVAALCAAATTYAVTVGVTRAWLGVHWPSDVLGGWLYGVSWTALAASAFIFARRRWAGRVPRA